MNTALAFGIILALDGTAGLLWPRRYLRILKVGPSAIRRTFEALAVRPALARGLCAAEIGTGLLLIRREA